MAVLSVALPLALRGPVLSWLVRASLRERCGEFSVGGGHLAWSSLWRLATGQPFSVELDSLRVAAPDHTELLTARLVRMNLIVRRRPLTIDIQNASVKDGNWQLSSRSGHRFADAFRQIPSQSRSACLMPPTSNASPPRVPAASLLVRNVRMDDVGIGLDFDEWALHFSHVVAEAEVFVPANAQPTFDVRGARAGETTLRIGPEKSSEEVQLSFDTVGVTHVAAPRWSPSDLEIAVEHARTGMADLSGEAVFARLFSPESSQPEPQLRLSTQWSGIAGALARGKASWLPDRKILERLQANLRAELHGPFSRLDGQARLDGDRFQLTVAVRQPTARASLLVSGLDTDWMLDPALASALGGRLAGHITVTSNLGPGLADLAVSVDQADLTLARSSTMIGPRKVRLRVGRSAFAAQSDALTLDVATARLSAAAIRVRDVRLRGRGFQLVGRATISMSRSAVVARNAVQAIASIDIPEVAQLAPRLGLQGPLHGAAAISGTARRMEATLSFRKNTALRLAKQRLSLPEALRARWYPGSDFVLAPFRVGLDAGSVTVAGHVEPDGALSGHLRVENLPLSPVLTLSPFALPVAAGVLNARLLVSGPWKDAIVEGTFQADGMRLWGSRPVSTSGVLRLVLDQHRSLHATSAMRVYGSGFENTTVLAFVDRGHAHAQADADIELGLLPPLWPAVVRSVRGRVHLALMADNESLPHARIQLDAMRDLAVQGPPSLPPVMVASGSSIVLADGLLRTPQLHLRWQGLHATLAGTLDVAPGAFMSSTANLILSVTLDAEQSAFQVSRLAVTGGKASLLAELSGSLEHIRSQARLSLQNIELRIEHAPSIRLQGDITAEDNLVRTNNLSVDIDQLGALDVGHAYAPAQIRLASVFPFHLQDIDIPIFGEHLSLERPDLPLHLPTVRVDAHLKGDTGAGMALSGDVVFEDASYDTRRGWSSTSANREPWYRAIPRNLTLDMTLSGHGLRVDVPVLPDLTFDLRCHLRAGHDFAQLTGTVQGESAYARSVVDIYQWFSSRDVRRCKLFTP